MTVLLSVVCGVGILYWLAAWVLRDELTPGPCPSTGPVRRADLTSLIERADAARQIDLAMVLEGVPVAMDDEPIALHNLADGVMAATTVRLETLRARDPARWN